MMKCAHRCRGNGGVPLFPAGDLWIFLILVLAAGFPLRAAAQPTTPAVRYTPSFVQPDASPVSYGWTFTATAPVTVSALGYFDAGGNGLAISYPVGIFNSSGAMIAGTTVAAGTTDPLIGDFRYRSISPITLTAGQTYTIAAFSPGPADPIAYVFGGTSGQPQAASGISVPDQASRYVYQSDAALRFPSFAAGYDIYGGPNFLIQQAAGTGGTIDYPASTPREFFTFNGDAAPQDDGSLRLTSSTPEGQRGSFFFNDPVNASAFDTMFRFRLTPRADRPADDPWADGITFTLQNQGPDALGESGSGMGYAGIPSSVALKFKTFGLGDPNAGGDPSQSTVGVLVNGQDPVGAGIGLTDLLAFGPDFDLGAGATFRANVVYANNRLTLTLTNEDTGRSIGLSFAVNLPAYIGANSAYAGFTGGTGTFVSDQRILSWQLSAPAAGTAGPVSPTITGITPASRPAGSASFSMTIRGAGFVPNSSVVRFDNTPMTILSATATQIVISVPASLLTTARRYNVTVATGGRFSNAVPFEVTRVAATAPAPALRIVGVQRSGVDYFTGRHYVVFLLENQGTAVVEGIGFTNVRLQTGPSTFIDRESVTVEPGAQPPGSLARMAPGQRLIVRFDFNIPPTSAGMVSVAGTSVQGAFNAGSRHVRFQ